MMYQMGDGMMGNGMMFGMGIGMLIAVLVILGLGFVAGYLVARRR